MYNKILIILFLFSHISYTYSEFSVYLNGDVFQFSGTNFPYTDSKFKFYGDESLIDITDDIHVDDDISSNSGYNLHYLHNDECIKYQYQHLKIKDQRGNEILLNFLYKVSNCTFSTPIYDQEYGVSLSLSNENSFLVTLFKNGEIQFKNFYLEGEGAHSITFGKENLPSTQSYKCKVEENWVCEFDTVCLSKYCRDKFTNEYPFYILLDPHHNVAPFAFIELLREQFLKEEFNRKICEYKDYDYYNDVKYYYIYCRDSIAEYHIPSLLYFISNDKGIKNSYASVFEKSG